MTRLRQGQSRPKGPQEQATEVRQEASEPPECCCADYPLRDLVPASATVKTATTQQNNNKNYDQNCGDIHMCLLSAPGRVRRSPSCPVGQELFLSL